MILVIGCGHVGGTIADVLEENGNEVVRIDPKLNDNKISSFKDKADGAIIAVPTPTVDGKCDVSILDDVVKELGDMKILIKSTVLPHLLEKYDDNVSYSPEFLREDHAVEDYKNQKLVVWGGEGKQIDWWINQFKDIFLRKLKSMNDVIQEVQKKSPTFINRGHHLPFIKGSWDKNLKFPKGQQEVDISKLWIDKSIQAYRQIWRIEDIIKNFNPTKCLPVDCVKDLNEDRFYVTEGQHRVIVLGLLGFNKIQVNIKREGIIKKYYEEDNKILVDEETYSNTSKQNAVTTRESAAVIKYVYNCWLATKVAFFHELHEKLDKSYNYNQVTSILSHFENIGPSHMKVTNLGYDGSCFPKDVEAFANFTDSEILKKVIEVNNNLVGAR